MQTKIRARESGDLYRDKPKSPNKKLHMTVDLPISVNSMYINTRNGGKTLNKHAKDYQTKTRARINAEIKDSGWKKSNDSTWYYLDMVVYMPDRKVRDSHNLLKLLLDTMEGLAYSNDYYVMPNILSVEYDKDNPRLELILRPQTAKERERILKQFKC